MSLMISKKAFGIITNRFSTSFKNFSKLSANMDTKYVTQTEATALDQDLFNEYKFSVDQLMELAGLSCASAIAKSYPSEKYRKVIIFCGPGNNGGDGLVAARHLQMMGFEPTIHYPKRPANTLYQNLTHQCVKYGIQFAEKCPNATEINGVYNIVVDALFGFSFKPPVRPEMLPQMEALANTTVPLCSIDIPSGWDVDNGPPADGPVLAPAMLISLSAPKICAKSFTGSFHYLGGRFIPQGLIEKYNLKLPEYPGAEQIVRLSS